MRALLAVGLLTCVCVATPRGRAAERTELIPFLHLDTEVGYGGEIQFGKLRELDAEANYRDVAVYNHSRHEMNVDIEFGLAPTLELDIRMPVVFQDRHHYRSSYDLTYDVGDDRTTMLGTAPLPAEELPDVKRGGFSDMWFALQWAPYDEAREGSKAQATMLFDVGISPPTGRNRYQVDSRGIAAPGSGGTDLRLAAGFSKRVRGGEPYLYASYLVTGRYEVELNDSQGRPVYPDPAKLNPANELMVLFGTEVFAMDNPAASTGLNVDIFGGFTYHTWADVETGTLLPVIHPNSVGHIATTAEYLEPHFGLGLYIRPASVVQVRLNVGVDYETSHILERIDTRNYEITTGPDTLRINFGLTVGGSFAPPKKSAQTVP